MKKLIVALVTAGVIAGVAAPAEAHAASWKRCSGMTSMSSVLWRRRHPALATRATR